MEKAIFMMDYLNISQGADGSFSHRGDKSLDLVGKDSGIDNLKAPFTGVVKRIYSNANAVWLESVNKVQYSDGTVDYMTMLTMHDNDVSNLKVGQVIKQGEVYFQEGTKGYATGNHVHLGIGKGKFTGNGWYENEYGNLCINNQYDVHKGLYLDGNVNIINGGGYSWIKVSDDDVNDTVVYIVKAGDNLIKIANKYNTTVDELVKVNNIKNKNLIYVNQKILIPLNGEYFEKYTGNSNSIVDALKNIKVNSSYEYREKIATVNRIDDYKGTAIQNQKLLDLLKKGQLFKP